MSAQGPRVFEPIAARIPPEFVNDLATIVRSTSDSDPISVLELGCGTGHMAAVLASLGMSVTAIDSSSAMIDRALELHGDLPNLNFIMSEFEHYVDDLVATDHPRFAAVYTYESYHLLASERRFFERAMAPLDARGILAVGYRLEPWEVQLGPQICEAFNSCGVEFSGWPYWVPEELEPERRHRYWEWARLRRVSTQALGLDSSLEFLLEINAAMRLTTLDRRRLAERLRLELESFDWSGGQEVEFVWQVYRRRSSK